MLEKALLEFLYTFILKKGEKLDLDHIRGNHFVDIPIVRQTKQTFRRTGILTIGTQQITEAQPLEELAASIKALKFTPGVKRKLNEDDPQTIKWLQTGFIIKEIRLKPDGRTPASQHYRMGYQLFNYQQTLQQQEEENSKNEHAQLKKDILQINISEDQPAIKQKMFQNLLDKFINACEQNQDIAKTLFPRTWSAIKRRRFLHFILAFVQLGANKQQFDWKEIGAAYYKEIGGSKVFDSYQKDFLEQFEQWSAYPASEFGLTSLGHITPVFFSGQLQGNYASYQYGPVHAVTNISLGLEEERYKTDATTLLIVENRGILTRIASQAHFLQTEATFVLCCDGHIRSAHRHFIKQLTTQQNMKQVIIWTDYDPDGMVIARELYDIVKNTIQVVKWISPTGEVHKTWNDYEDNMDEFLQKNTMEQEERIGDVERWKSWINS